jgi:hypothetical protein
MKDLLKVIIIIRTANFNFILHNQIISSRIINNKGTYI